MNYSIRETPFKNKVKGWLESKGAWYIKYWAGAKFTKEGIPDILACIDGVFCGIELKATNGHPTLLQLVNLKKIREAGGIGVLLYPNDLEDFASFVSGSDDEWYQGNIEKQRRWFEKLS